MRNEHNNKGLKILHIRQATCDRPLTAIPPDSMDTLLQSSSLDVEQCSDVYRGMAHIGTKKSQTPDIAIVCIDGLSSAEMEFFSIIARIHRQISVYVYSQRSARTRIDRAIELGAAGIASAELIQSIIDSQTTTLQDLHQHSHEIDEATHSRPQQLIAGDTLPIQEPDDTTESESTAQDISTQPTLESEIIPREDEAKKEISYELDELNPDDEYTAPARVPWVRYQDRPARQAPQRRQPPTPQETLSPPSKMKKILDEPLLTEEELEALLGDDISAIAPVEQDALFSDNTTNGESAS